VATSHEREPVAEYSAATPEQRLALLIEAVQEYAIFMLDADGTVATWNGGASRIKGYRPEEIVGKHVSVFYTPEDVAAGKPQRELETAAAGGSCRDEGWRVRKDGSTFWANVLITALFDADGHVQGYAKVTRDETDRRLAAQQDHELERVRDLERIATELHGTIVHRVFQAGLALQGSLGLIDEPKAVQRVQEAIDLLDEVAKDVRAVVLDFEEDR
jgi:PAS domain S-box-containing protein